MARMHAPRSACCIMLAVAIHVLGAMASPPLTPDASVPLTLLPSNTSGRCLDGTPSGYYFAPGTSSSKWVFALDGGGECNSQSSCTSKLTSSLGSSKFFARSTDFSGQWYLDGDATRNPGFATWNHVRVAYCTQDLHMGTLRAPSASTWGLLFSGQLVWEAVLADLASRAGLEDATDIVISGESAGGIGAWPKLDATAARFPRARVVGAPIAGFYSWSFPYTGENATAGGLANFSPAGIRELYDLYRPSLNAACVVALSADPSPCMLSNNSLPYVAADLFVTEALTDSVQLTAHDNIPAEYINLPPELAYITAWSANMTAALAPVLGASSPPSRGGFAAACFTHTSFSAAKPLIRGASFLQAAAAWYAGSGDYKLSDNCGAPFCNPTCP